MKTYAVLAARSQGWWGLTVPEVPGAVSQVRSLAQAEEYIREAIAFVAGMDPASFGVDVVPQLPDPLAVEVGRARRAAAAAEQTQATAAALSRAVVAKLAAAGYNGRETAAILGLSKQRVSQLAAASAAAGGETDKPPTSTRRSATTPRGSARRAISGRSVVTGAGKSAVQAAAKSTVTERSARNSPSRTEQVNGRTAKAE